MGAASSCYDEQIEIQKFRNLLVMRAFNLRKGGTTLQQQFHFLKTRDEDNASTISSNELADYLKLPPHRRANLETLFQAQGDGRIKYDDFITFMVEGLPKHSTIHQSPSASEPNAQTNQEPEVCDPEVCDPEVLSEPEAEIQASGREESSEQLIPYCPPTADQLVKGFPKTPGLWKKREITIQERITEYTKIDDNGVPQYLVESEKQQLEVIHMETVTGEFAHREITHMEQLEKLNDEVVHHESGKEEFVHLKSDVDEFSHFESTMPQAGPDACEAPPESPSIKHDGSAEPTAFQMDDMEQMEPMDEVPEDDSDC